MVNLAISIFEFLTKFLVFWDPWYPWVCARSDLKQIWAIPLTVQKSFKWTKSVLLNLSPMLLSKPLSRINMDSEKKGWAGDRKKVSQVDFNIQKMVCCLEEKIFKCTMSVFLINSIFLLFLTGDDLIIECFNHHVG